MFFASRNYSGGTEAHASTHNSQLSIFGTFEAESSLSGRPLHAFANTICIVGLEALRANMDEVADAIPSRHQDSNVEDGVAILCAQAAR